MPCQRLGGAAYVTWRSQRVFSRAQNGRRDSGRAWPCPTRWYISFKTSEFTRKMVMHTLQPTLRLGRDVWDPAAMPVEEFKSRVAWCRNEMRGRSIEAMLLYGNGLDECGYPAYLSNYTVKLPFAALV